MINMTPYHYIPDYKKEMDFSTIPKIDPQKITVEKDSSLSKYKFFYRSEQPLKTSSHWEFTYIAMQGKVSDKIEFSTLSNSENCIPKFCIVDMLTVEDAKKESLYSLEEWQLIENEEPHFESIIISDEEIPPYVVQEHTMLQRFLEKLHFNTNQNINSSEIESLWSSQNDDIKFWAEDPISWKIDPHYQCDDSCRNSDL